MIRFFLLLLVTTASVTSAFFLTLYYEEVEANKITYEDVVASTLVRATLERNYPNFEYKMEIVKPKTKPVVEKIPEAKTINKFKKKVNKDYLGSISIPVIDTADSIYKSKGDYYLSHSFEKVPNELGELYIDERTGAGLTDNGSLIHGHAVKNGSKFGNFKKLLDIDEQPEVIIWDETLQEEVRYKMMFISLIDGSNSGIVLKFDNEEMQLSYYQHLYDTAIMQWEEPTEGDYLILNSCSYIIKDGRYVVFAKKEVDSNEL